MNQHKIVTVTLNPSVDKTITVDGWTQFGLNRALRTRVDAGGKGINVAKVLKDFGANVLVTGLIAGNQGAFLLNRLKEAEIAQDFLEIAGETRTNLKIFDESVHKMTELNETGFSVTAEALAEYQQRFQQAMEQTAVVVLSGSLPPGVPKQFYAECITLAKANGVKAILDADGAALAAGIQAVPYAVKPNLHELEMLTGKQFTSKAAVAAAARELIQTGISVVIVSMGADGAVVVGREEAYQVDSWHIPVKSATGAGDSMVAALAYSLVHQASLYDIAKITTAAGTITASKEGTQTCTLTEVQQSLQFVAVNTLQLIPYFNIF